MHRTAKWLALLLALLLLPLTPALAEEPADEVPMIVRCGGSFVYAIDRSGQIWGWGDNRKGQAAYEQYRLVRTPMLVATNLDGREVLDIQCGNENALFLMKDGTVYACGANDHSRLGVREQQGSANQPILIPTLSNIVQIDCGFGQSLALDADGHVWGWGKNSEGQVGVGHRQTVEEPVDLGLENIVQIGCGGRYSMAMDANGVVYAWGENDYGQAMAGKDAVNPTPTPIDLGGITVAQIATGGDTAYVLDDEGHVWAWGRNDFYQCGDNAPGERVNAPIRVLIPDEEHVVRIIAYSSHTMALTDEGKLWLWGSTGTGQMGLGSRTSKSLPTCSYESGVIDASVGSLCCALLLEDGSVLCTGYNEFGQLGIGLYTQSTWTRNGLNLIRCTLEQP